MFKRLGLTFLFWGFVWGLAFSWTSGLAFGQETSAGKQSLISLSSIFLQPQAHLSELSQGGFDVFLWDIEVQSHFAPWIDVRASVGASGLLGRPYWSPAPTGPVALVDGVATLHTTVGAFYGGQFLLPWGLEGQTTEPQLWLPRSLLYELGYFPLRDDGAGFRTESDGFYMNVAAHNGEGAGLPDSDNRVFVTGQWGYLGPAHSNFGLSGTAGHVALPQTLEQHVRGVNAFFGFNIFGLGLQVEGSYLESVNQLTTSDVLAWHADVEQPISDVINFIARYEQLNPNMKVTSNVLGRGYAGLEFHSRDSASRVFLFAIKNNESLNETPNDEVRVAWRISPPLE